MRQKLRAILYRVLQLLVLGLLLYGFAQTLPLDIALLLAGDSLLYIEITTAVWLTAQVTRLRFALAYARTIARRAVRCTRWRARRLVRRATARKPADEPDRAFAYA